MPEKVIHIKLTRDPDGARLYIQSKFSWAFLYRENTTQDIVVGGVNCRYAKPDIRMDGVPVIWNQTVPHLFVNNVVNATFLTARDIKNGVTFNLGTQPMSSTFMKKFTEQLKVAAKELYKNYMKPVDIEVLLETTERELVN